METKFTKGKWEVDYETNSVITKADVIGDIICDAPEYADDSMQKWQANALLISKAPEMFEILLKICEFHEKNASWDKGDNGYYEAKRIIKELINI